MRQLLGACSAPDRRRYLYKHRIRHNGDVNARYDGLSNPQGFCMSWFILKQGCDDNRTVDGQLFHQILSRFSLCPDG
jgi:hypothetical protein